MNAVLLTNNEKLYHQTEGGSELLLPENVKLFGKYVMFKELHVSEIIITF